MGALGPAALREARSVRPLAGTGGGSSNQPASRAWFRAGRTPPSGRPAGEARTGHPGHSTPARAPRHPPPPAGREARSDVARRPGRAWSSQRGRHHGASRGYRRSRVGARWSRRCPRAAGRECASGLARPVQAVGGPVQSGVRPWRHRPPCHPRLRVDAGRAHRRSPAMPRPRSAATRTVGFASLTSWQRCGVAAGSRSAANAPAAAARTTGRGCRDAASSRGHASLRSASPRAVTNAACSPASSDSSARLMSSVLPIRAVALPAARRTSQFESERRVRKVSRPAGPAMRGKAKAVAARTFGSSSRAASSAVARAAGSAAAAAAASANGRVAARSRAARTALRASAPAGAAQREGGRSDTDVRVGSGLEHSASRVGATRCDRRPQRQQVPMDARHPPRWHAVRW